MIATLSALFTREIALCNELNNVLNTLPYVKTLSDDIGRLFSRVLISVEDMNKTTTIDHIDNTSYRVIEGNSSISFAIRRIYGLDTCGVSHSFGASDRRFLLRACDQYSSFSTLDSLDCKWSKNGDYIAVTGKDASLYIYSYAEGRVYWLRSGFSTD